MKILQTVGLFFTFVLSTHALVVATPFKEQIKRADAVARIVVVQIAKLEYANKEDGAFTGIAKCRVITDYTGALINMNFIYIPCDYTYDESPSPLEVGRDYIINLELLHSGSIAHPVSYDAAHEVSNRKLIDPESNAPEIFLTLEDFETRLRAYLQKKAEQVSSKQPEPIPASMPERSEKLQLKADEQSR
jgi:hypothetical protein